MSSFVLSAAVVVANVTGAGMIVPQVVRLRRHCRVDGVSPIWVGVGVALNGWWLGYAIGADVLALAPVAAMGVVLYGVIAVQYTQIVGTHALRPMFAGAAGASIAPASALAVGGWSATGIAMGLAYSVQFAPAVWAVLRAHELTGVSVGTWVLALIEAVAWFGYGAAIVDPALVLGGIGGTVMSSTILVRVAMDRMVRRGTAWPTRELDPGVAAVISVD